LDINKYFIGKISFKSYSVHCLADILPFWCFRRMNLCLENRAVTFAKLVRKHFTKHLILKYSCCFSAQSP